MKTLVMAAAVVLLLGATAQAGWYVGPLGGYVYYPDPVYAYPAPLPHAVYSPVPAPVVAAPVVAAPVVVGPPAVIVRPKVVYVRGQPVRNVLRNVLP